MEIFIWQIGIQITRIEKGMLIMQVACKLDNYSRSYDIYEEGNNVSFISLVRVALLSLEGERPDVFFR